MGKGVLGGRGRVKHGVKKLREKWVQGRVVKGSGWQRWGGVILNQGSSQL